MRLHPLSARPACYNSCSDRKKERKRKEKKRVVYCTGLLQIGKERKNSKFTKRFPLLDDFVNIQDDIKPCPFISPQSSPTSYPVPYPMTHLTAYRPNNVSLDLPPCFFLSLSRSTIIPPYLLSSFFTPLFIPISKPTNCKLCQPFPQLRDTYIPTYLHLRSMKPPPQHQPGTIPSHIPRLPSSQLPPFIFTQP